METQARRFPLRVWRFLALALRPELQGCRAEQLAAASRGRLRVAQVRRYLANHRIVELLMTERAKAQAAVLQPVDEAMVREARGGNAKAAALAYERIGGWASGQSAGLGALTMGRPRRIVILDLDGDPVRGLPEPGARAAA